MKNKPDIIFKTEDKPAVEEMTEFLRTLNVREQERMEDIMKGIKIGIAIKEKESKSEKELIKTKQVLGRKGIRWNLKKQRKKQGNLLRELQKAEQRWERH